MLLSGGGLLIKDRNHVPLLRRHGAARSDGEWKKIMYKTSISPLYISLDSPKDCLPSAISSYAWATWKTNCLLSVFLPHAHTPFPSRIIPFFLLIFIYISLSHAAVCLHLFLLTYLLSFLLYPSLSHVYTSLFTHHCVLSLMPFWKPLN